MFIQKYNMFKTFLIRTSGIRYLPTLFGLHLVSENSASQVKPS